MNRYFAFWIAVLVTAAAWAAARAYADVGEMVALAAPVRNNSPSYASRGRLILVQSDKRVFACAGQVHYSVNGPRGRMYQNLVSEFVVDGPQGRQIIRPEFEKAFVNLERDIVYFFYRHTPQTKKLTAEKLSRRPVSVGDSIMLDVSYSRGDTKKGPQATAAKSDDGRWIGALHGKGGQSGSPVRSESGEIVGQFDSTANDPTAENDSFFNRLDFETVAADLDAITSGRAEEKGFQMVRPGGRVEGCKNYMYYWR